jgi:hypothetical protein
MLFGITVLVLSHKLRLRSERGVMPEEGREGVKPYEASPALLNNGCLLVFP